MKKKGFTTIEIIIPVVLTSLIVIVLFNMIFSLKDLYINAILRIELLNKQTIMNQNLNKLLVSKNIISLNGCGDNCITFTFDDETTTNLEINKENNTFSIGEYKTKLVKGSTFENIVLKIKHIDNVDENKNDSYLKIYIPIKHNLLNNEDYGINTIYQYDSNKIAINNIR